MLMVKKIALVVGFGVLGAAAAAQAIVSNGGSVPSMDSAAPATTMVAPAPGDSSEPKDKPKCTNHCRSKVSTPMQASSL